MANNQLGENWWDLPGYGGAFNPHVSYGAGGSEGNTGTGTGDSAPQTGGGGGGGGGLPFDFGGGGGPATGAAASGAASTAAAAVPWYKNASTIGQIISAVSSLYGLGKGSGSTPNVYPVPLTPNEVTESDAKKSLFGYASSWVDQYLRGLGNLNPTWAPNSPLLGPNGGGGFMGGVKVPQIDFSKMPSAPSASPAGSSAAGSVPGGTNVTIDDIRSAFGEPGVTMAQSLMTQNPQITLAAIYGILQHVLGGSAGAGAQVGVPTQRMP